MRIILSLSLLLSFLWLTSCSDEAVEPEITPSATSIQVKAGAYDWKFKLTSNTKWTVSPSDNWFTVNPETGNAGETDITVHISANYTEKKRSGIINFIAGNKTSSIPVEQDLQQVLTLPIKNLTVNNDAHTFAVNLGLDYQIIIPSGISWVTSNEEDGVLKLSIAKNYTGKDRVCKVTFKNKDTGGILETLIIQRPEVSSGDLLKITSLKIDGIPCITDQETLQMFFPVDMDLASPQLNRKIEFEGEGIEYLKVKGEDKKIYSGETVRFNEFAAKTKITFVTGNSLLDSEKEAILNITGLPIISIHAPNGIVDDPKSPCDMIFIDPKGRTNYGDQKNLKYFEAYAGIEWRGSGALLYDKKAYGFKLANKSNGESIDAELLGLRDDNNWILDAMWLDKARMRNRVLFDVWNEFNELYYKKDKEPKANSGTHGHLVEVFLDGRYHGMYALSDKLDRKQLKLKKEGGYLYKITDWTDECLFRGRHSNYDNSQLKWSGIEMDYPDEIGKIEFKYYDNLLRFILESSSQEFSDRFEEMIDINNMVDHFIYTNLFVGYDNIGRNTFWAIYDVKQSTKMIPLIWDLDGTLGRTWDRQQEDPNQSFLVYSRHNGYSYRIYKRILNDNPADIKSKIRARWAEIKNGAVSITNMYAKLDYYANQQVNSGADLREIRRWSGSPAYDYSDVMGEVKYIKEWYAKRWAKMDQMITGSDLDRTNW
ncbi:MAG: CotH kinase family protein [Prevotella sp.]|jgi:hypothetical protein|nr:CotH kinase family protein [Prevotella sp.]